MEKPRQEADVGTERSRKIREGAREKSPVFLLAHLYIILLSKAKKTTATDRRGLCHDVTLLHNC